MPLLNKGSSNVIILPQSYSQATIARRFEVLRELRVDGAVCQIVYDDDVPLAAVVRKEPADINGQLRHEIIATLEMVRRSEFDDLITVGKFWQESEALQIEGVVVNAPLRNRGLATAIYECLVLNKNIVLVSDNYHYESGKALWQSIARTSEQLNVFVLDAEEGNFYPYDGERVRYDQQSIPEAEIWSVQPDEARLGIVLVAEDARKHPRIAA